MYKYYHIIQTRKRGREKKMIIIKTPVPNARCNIYYIVFSTADAAVLGLFSFHYRHAPGSFSGFSYHTPLPATTELEKSHVHVTQEKNKNLK